MDSDWMQERLEKYLATCDELTARVAAIDSYWDDGCREINGRVELQIATVSRIVKLMNPTWMGELQPPSFGGDGERLVRQTLGAVLDSAEWKTHLAPEAPSLEADRLHPTIWEAASTVWETGQYRVAVQQAAVSLSAHIKARVNSTLNDRKLMQQVFSPDAPKPGQPRLHFPGDPADDNWQSRQQGLHLMAQGAFAGGRNIAAHDDKPWTDHEALEMLAVLSVIARWAQEAALVSAS